MTQRFAELLERAADELLDARSFDEWTGEPRGGNVILESDAALLRTLATAMREAKFVASISYGNNPPVTHDTWQITLPQEAP